MVIYGVHVPPPLNAETMFVVWPTRGAHRGSHGSHHNGIASVFKPVYYFPNPNIIMEGGG